MKDSLSFSERFGTGHWLEGLQHWNSITEYLIGAIVIVVAILTINVIRRVLKKRLGNLDTLFGHYVLDVLAFVSPLLYLAIFFAVFKYYSVSRSVEQVMHYAFKVAFMVLVIRLIVAALRSAIYTYLKHQDETGDKIKQVRGIVLIMTGVLWLLGLIFMFDNLGFNVTAVLTGLGVGGIAIALAAQTILGDIFNYFVIFFDRPFEVGDFIIVDDKMGTVEYIGIKTTRIKSLSGEQIIFANSNLTNSRLHNYKRMNERRVVFQFGVVYSTERSHLANLPDKVKAIIDNIEDARFDRAHLAKFGAYSIDFEVVYYVQGGDYNRYMDIQQRINLELFDLLKADSVEFAFPTYSLHLERTKQENGQLN